MEWHVNPDWRPPHAVRPWRIPDTPARGKMIHYCESEAAVQTCLRCTRSDCSGDCADHKAALGKTRRPGTKKGIDPANVVKMKNRGLSAKIIAETLGISENGVRYWLKKMGAS